METPTENKPSHTPPPLRTCCISLTLQTASILIVHEPHKAERITSSVPLRRPKYFRSAQWEEGLSETVVAVLTDSFRTFFLLEQPSRIQQKTEPYTRYTKIVGSIVLNIPTIEVFESPDLVCFVTVLPELAVLYRNVLNEHNRFRDTTSSTVRHF